MRIPRRLNALVVCAVFINHSVCAFAQDANPIESKTWYVEASHRLSEITDRLEPSGAKLPVSDATLISMVYDALQDEPTAAIVEQLAKLDIVTPNALPEKSTQRGIYSFTQLGHLQVAYMPMFAKMSAQAADDLFKNAQSPLTEAAWNQTSLARLWMRLGETDKALTVLDAESSLYLEHRIDLIRTGFAAAKVHEARKLADTTLDVVRKTSPDVTDTLARNMAQLIDTLVDCGEIDLAREAIKTIPPSEDALPAYKAICTYDIAHGEEDAFATDLNAMVEMLSRMDEFDSGQSNACVRAAEICIKVKRGADAIRCLDRLDQLADQPDPPLITPLTWATAARLSLYTTANDRADGYLLRCARSIAADKDATDGDRLLADIAMARLYGVSGNFAEFEKRMNSITPRLKTTDAFLAPYLLRAMYVELAQVSREEKIVATIRRMVDRKARGDGEVALAMVRRLIRTGDSSGARELAASLAETNWRLRAMIEVTHARMEIPDETEQRAALDDIRTLESPREAAYIMLGVGARLSGNEGYIGDELMRKDPLE